MKFRCPNCGQHLECDDQDAGLNFQCPKCNNVVLAQRIAKPAKSKLDEAVTGCLSYILGSIILIVIICYAINSCNSVDKTELKDLKNQIETKQQEIEKLKKENKQQAKEFDICKSVIQEFPDAKKEFESKKANQEELPDAGFAWVQAQYFVEAELKNPKSAKFEPAGHRNAEVSKLSRIFIFRSYVDSQNSFGGTVRTYFFCKLRHWNGKWEKLQLTFSEHPF